MVDGLIEMPAFQRALSKLDPGLQERWATVKDALAMTTASNGTDFKRWRRGGDDCYSVRVGRNLRAHLRHDRDTSTWFAEEIGSHKAMGHG
jgi:hypothetical protein